MISPAFTFISIWIMVVWLQALHIFDFYEPIDNDFLIVLALLCVVILISEVLIKIYYQMRRKVIIDIKSQSLCLNSLIKKLFPLLLLMFVVDTIYSGGFPLIWLIIGDGRTHVDFGMPTFHGAFHGLLLFFATSSFVLYRHTVHQKKNLRNIFFFLLYAVIAFNRGIVVIFAVQALFIYLITIKKIKFKYIFYILISALLFFWVFGILGDYRMGDNVFAKSISENWLEFFEVVPKSFAWFYAYVTGGVNNVYANVTEIQPTYVPQYTFAKLVPSVVYGWMDIPKSYDAFTLADARLTVSTAFHGLISDFGLIGVFLYGPVVFFAQIHYRRAKRKSMFSILFYGMFMQTIVMTLYIDTIFYLTFLLQLLLVLYIQFRYRFYLYSIKSVGNK